MDPTQDPHQTADAETSPDMAAADVPVLEFLFHPDPRRIGDRVRVPSDGADLLVGRSGPDFTAPDGGHAAPWDDPCISREQLRVRFRPTQGVFEVAVAPGARRAVSPGPGLYPPGTRLAVEDRALLLLTLRRPDAAGPRRGLLGESPAIARVRDLIARYAASPHPVLLIGETGSGKELAAHALHAAGPHAAGRFVAVNCGALPESLVEGEIFGHARGAYTGADRAQPGLVAAAHRGTLFLDEVAELPLDAQAKLLRFLDAGAYRPLGETTERHAEAKVVAATHRDLPAMVAAGRFRQDLYFRLNGLSIALPPLRARVEDAPRLLVGFLAGGTTPPPWLAEPVTARTPRLPLAFVERLLAHPWPGNVRELRSVAERLLLDGVEAALQGLSAPVGPAATPAPTPAADVSPRPLARPRRTLPDDAAIVEALEANEFVKSRTAEALGISRNHLDKRLQAMGRPSPLELTDAELAAARAETAGDLNAMARRLGVSSRGLQLRLARSPHPTV